MDSRKLPALLRPIEHSRCSEGPAFMLALLQRHAQQPKPVFLNKRRDCRPHPQLGEAAHKSILFALILGLGIPTIGDPAAYSSPQDLLLLASCVLLPAC